MVRTFTIATATLLAIAFMTPAFAKGGGGGKSMSGGGMSMGKSMGGAKKKGGGAPDFSFLDDGSANACPSGQTYQCRASAYAGRPEICGCSSRR
jgi:hypothetical protein